MSRTVDLVATRDAILKYFPDARPPHPLTQPGIMSAPFPIVPETCQTALGRWLAERIATTRFDDDAARCRVLLPATEIGLHVRELSERLARRQELTPDAAEALFAEISAWIDHQRKAMSMWGAHAGAYRTFDYQWPVFGSAKAGGAATPEAYFDECAKQIRMTGGVILGVGISNEPPPTNLLSSMARDAGGGLALLERYNKWRALAHGAIFKPRAA